MTLPLGTRAHYRPHHPDGVWSPFVWRVCRVTTSQEDWQVRPVTFYTLRCESALPWTRHLEYCVRQDMLEAIAPSTEKDTRC